MNRYEPKCPECMFWSGHSGSCISRPDYRGALAPVSPHDHEWMPAGLMESDNRMSVIVWGMCKCGEIMPKQWDY